MLASRVVAIQNGFPENSGDARDAPLTNILSYDGNFLQLDIGGGFFAYYCHCVPNSFLVKPGDYVTEGAPVALLGNSGNSLQPHLHFQVTDGPDIWNSTGIPIVLKLYVKTAVCWPPWAFIAPESFNNALMEGNYLVKTERVNMPMVLTISNQFQLTTPMHYQFVTASDHFYRFPSPIHRVLTPFSRTSLSKPFPTIYLCFFKQKQKKMKATTTILAVILTLSMNVLFASNDGAAVNSETNSFHTSLAPATPAEATFEEINDATVTAFILAPVSPIEADFSDAISETTIDIITLAPVTPIEADFQSHEDTTNVSAFAPVTPSVADFTDGI